MEDFKQQILNFREFEFTTTLKVLRAYPADKLDMKPADKSRTAGELMTVFVREEYVCRGAMLGNIHQPDSPKNLPVDPEKLLELFSQVHREVQEMIASAGDAELSRIIDFYGYQIRALDALWAELHDQIHHRGQLSVYLRLAGAKVPSIYGPTADEPMGTGN